MVFRAFESASTALMSTLVPYYLGFNHITRHQVIDQHTSAISRRLI